jgi:Bacterial PH domain
MGIKEETFYEGGPHIGDLLFNIFLGIFVVFIPFTVAAIVRALWVRYKITDRRVSVVGGWFGRDRTDIIYTDIVDAIKIPRGLGLWGDMVLVLKNGDRLEMRAVPKYVETFEYINERVQAKTGESFKSLSKAA